jgi:hypothetical protein
MEKVLDFKGLGGILNGFRDLVKDDGRITFIGSPGFCTPFALFLGYTVRDKHLAFIPGLDPEKARSVIPTDYGMELGGPTNADADTIVILGGMAMPKIGASPKQVEELLKKIEHKRVIGVCFMSIFEKSGWCQLLGFDYVINANLEGEISN